jgi:hypothetical protein
MFTLSCSVSASSATRAFITDPGVSPREDYETAESQCEMVTTYCPIGELRLGAYGRNDVFKRGLLIASRLHEPLGRSKGFSLVWLLDRFLRPVVIHNGWWLAIEPEGRRTRNRRRRPGAWHRVPTYAK